MTNHPLPDVASYVRPAPNPAMPATPYLRVVFSLGHDTGEFIYDASNVHAARKAGEILSYILTNGGNIEGAANMEGALAMDRMLECRPDGNNVLPVTGVAVTIPCGGLSGYWRIKRDQQSRR